MKSYTCQKCQEFLGPFDVVHPYKEMVIDVGTNTARCISCWKKREKKKKELRDG